jgi:2-polyprenyl-3-methyl-5-hydroxy-6-metoxy-1,4-benzoquinol methylase
MPGDLTDSGFWDKKHSSEEAAKGRLSGWIREKIHWKYDRMICRMLDAIGKKQAEILELGCAPGTVLERVHRLRPQFRLAGIDYSEEGIGITRERLVSLGIEADIYCGDFRKLSLPKQYDAAVSFGLIEHFENPIEILKSHENFVAPGGLVAVSVPNFSHPVVESLLRRFDPDILITHNLAIMNEKSLARALESCGLENVSVGGAGGPRLYFETRKPSVDF